ncbi:MAG TPA: hypothetical protein VEB67_01840 [Nitrososphaerales archaeon]|nr:hypothetical protein [Nitrososphaerales archaeon]
MANAKTSKADSSVTKAKPPVAFDKLYWARIGFAVVGAFLANVLVADWSLGLSIGIGIYLLSYYVAKYTWYRGSGPEIQGKVYTTGIGSYALVFIFTWILLFTLQVVGFSA